MYVIVILGIKLDVTRLTDMTSANVTDAMHADDGFRHSGHMRPSGASMGHINSGRFHGIKLCTGYNDGIEDGFTTLILCHKCSMVNERSDEMTW